MKSIIDDTDAIAARLKDIERTSVPEPAPAQQPAASVPNQADVDYVDYSGFDYLGGF